MQQELYDYDDYGWLVEDDIQPETGCLFGLMGWGMMLVFLLIMLALSSCGSQRTVVVEVRDSTATHVHHEVIYVPDTIPVVLPPQVVEHVTPDTIDTLRIDCAESTAAIRDGMLHHSLRSLQNPIPVQVLHKETVRDSIVYRWKEVPVPVPEEVEVEKPLSWWQQTRLHLANIVLVLLCIYAIAWAVRKKLKMKS